MLAIFALFAALGGAVKADPPTVMISASTKDAASPAAPTPTPVQAKSTAQQNRREALEAVVAARGGPYIHETVWCETNAQANPDAATKTWLVEHRPPFAGDVDKFCAHVRARRGALRNAKK